MAAGTWHRRVVGLVVALGVGLAACSGDDGGEDGRAAGDELSASASAGDGGDPGDGSRTTTTLEACDVVGASDAEAATSVELSLTEYAIAPASQEVPAGPVELVAANDGRIWHEVIVVRLDGDPGSLPLDPYGGADESQIPEDDVVGKMREFLAGTTCRATFDLAPGRYALICNVVDDGSNPHYSQGMYGGLTVA